MGCGNLMVFTGNANPDLASAVVSELGIPLGKAKVGRFSDGEVQVEIKKTCVVNTSSFCNRYAPLQ